MSGDRLRDLMSSETGGDAPLEALLPRRKLIVVIGIDEYARLPKLRCAVSDALGVQRVLVERFGFVAPIPALINGAATKPAIETLVEDQLRETLEPEDALILFFAGHGTTRVARLDAMTVETGYLAPVEARGPDRFSDLINMEELMRKIGLLPARHILMVIDACHSGMALGAAASQYRTLDSFVHRLIRNRSRRVITSARRDEPALDSGPIPGHSLFTGTLIQALTSGEADTDGNGVITFSELALFLQQRVGQASGSKQTPDYGSSHLDDRGELVIAVGGPAERPTEAQDHATEQRVGVEAPGTPLDPGERIEALHRQFLTGITALKTSTITGWGSFGPIEAPPWYVVIGPPGAGKSTALRRSNLLPFHVPSEGGGAGVTRNLEWWFSKEAVFLDTMGRYVTEPSHHDEWMALLGQVSTYRKRPINGVIVVVSAHDLLDTDDEATHRMCWMLRSRLDELQSTLRVVVPVYVVFSKWDRIAGFSAFFGDLGAEARAQAWGATLYLDASKSKPEWSFDVEFDRLVQRIHEITLTRLKRLRAEKVQAKIYQFPVEFAAAKYALHDFIERCFTPLPNAAPPTLRGFYFTSAVQEGEPEGRVATAMGLAFGLRGAAAVEPRTPQESRSYFLHDVFTKIVIPDQGISKPFGGPVGPKSKRAVAVVAGLVAAISIVPPFISFFKNQELVDETSNISEATALVKWEDSTTSALDKLDKLDRLRRQVDLLDRYENKNEKQSLLGWGMYQGGVLYQATTKQYAATLERAFISPSKKRLESRFESAMPRSKTYLEDYNALKAYLLLNDPAHLPEYEDWEVEQLTDAWTKILRDSMDSETSEAALRLRIQPHVKYYIDLLRRGVVKEVLLDDALIARAREALGKTDPREGYYDKFVTSLAGELYVATESASLANHKYPPITLDLLFPERPDVLLRLRSARKDREGKWFEVEGPYTLKGYKQVITSLSQGKQIIERERWVVPATEKETQIALARVRMDYELEHRSQWTSFFKDTRVLLPKNNGDAVSQLRLLATPEWPYLRLLKLLATSTQFEATEPPPDKAAPKEPMISAAFRSTCAFGVPPASNPSLETPLARYIGAIQNLIAELESVRNGVVVGNTPAAEQAFAAAVKETRVLLLTMDPTGQDLLAPLLLNPLKAQVTPLIR